MHLTKLLLFSALGFAIPVGTVISVNWESARPYFHIDADSPKPGKVLYFYADT